MHFLRALRRSVWYAFALFGVLLFIHPAGLLAQAGTAGTLAGVVKDPSGSGRGECRGHHCRSGERLHAHRQQRNRG